MRACQETMWRTCGSQPTLSTTACPACNMQVAIEKVPSSSNAPVAGGCRAAQQNGDRHAIGGGAGCEDRHIIAQICIYQPLQLRFCILSFLILRHFVGQSAEVLAMIKVGPSAGSGAGTCSTMAEYICLHVSTHRVAWACIELMHLQRLRETAEDVRRNFVEPQHRCCEARRVPRPCLNAQPLADQRRRVGSLFVLHEHLRGSCGA